MTCGYQDHIVVCGLEAWYVKKDVKKVNTILVGLFS